VASRRRAKLFIAHLFDHHITTWQKIIWNREASQFDLS